MESAVTGDVIGFCPACGSPELSLLDTGHLHCGNVDCVQRTAPHQLLQDSETDHIVRIETHWPEAHRLSYTLRHPLIERLGDGIMSCHLANWLDEWGDHHLCSGALQLRNYRFTVVGFGEDFDYEWELIP